METLLSLCVGVGLSAACGFRVFVPLLIMSAAAQSGHLELTAGFAWIGTAPALTAFAVATFCEVLSYYIPVVDNLLDVIATPAAVVAGTIVAASVVTGMSPFWTWSAAIIAGGGVAELVTLAERFVYIWATSSTNSLRVIDCSRGMGRRANSRNSTRRSLRLSTSLTIAEMEPSNTF